MGFINNIVSIRSVLLFATCLCWSIAASAQGMPFMSVDEFTKSHPEQKRIMADFEAIVHSPVFPISPKDNKQVRIAFIYPSQQVSDYWRRSINSFKGRLTESGISFIIDEHYSKPSESLQRQARQIEQSLRNTPDYLVFTLDVFSHKKIIEKLLEQKQTKLILQNITTPIREWEGRQPFMYVGFDHAMGSRMLAGYFLEKTGGTGNYGMLYFTRGYVSTMRGETFRSYVSTRGLRQVDEEYTNGMVRTSQNAASRMIAEHDPDVLFACSTDTALGAIRAIKAAGKRGEVMINGWGGGSGELDAIRNGDMDVTVMRMNDDNGVAMADAIRLDLEGKGHQVPNVFSGEMVLVEKGISKEKLDKFIKRAFRYSGH